MCVDGYCRVMSVSSVRLPHARCGAILSKLQGGTWPSPHPQPMVPLGCSAGRQWVSSGSPSVSWPSSPGLCPLFCLQGHPPSSQPHMHLCPPSCLPAASLGACSVSHNCTLAWAGTSCSPCLGPPCTHSLFHLGVKCTPGQLRGCWVPVPLFGGGTGSHFLAQGGLELGAILLSQSPSS